MKQLILVAVVIFLFAALTFGVLLYDKNQGISHTSSEFHKLEEWGERLIAIGSAGRFCGSTEQLLDYTRNESGIDVDARTRLRSCFQGATLRRLQYDSEQRTYLAIYRCEGPDFIGELQIATAELLSTQTEINDCVFGVAPENSMLPLGRIAPVNLR